MAQDLKKLFKNEQNVSNLKMPDGHEARFLKKIDEELPKKSSNRRFTFFNVAASVVVLIGLGFAAYKYTAVTPVEPTEVVGTTKSIEDISPQLKKVEDYYLANINLELSKLEYSPENKELFDGYVERLGELSKEYELLSNELIESGPSEQTVTALIDNLKIRLSMLYRLKEKLNELNDESTYEKIQS